MSDSTITLIIIACTSLLYMTERKQKDSEE